MALWVWLCGLGCAVGAVWSAGEIEARLQAESSRTESSAEIGDLTRLRAGLWTKKVGGEVPGERDGGLGCELAGGIAGERDRE